MALRDLIISDLTTFLADFGQAATYTPAGSAGTSISVIFDKKSLKTSVGGVEVEIAGPVIQCKTSDIAGAAVNDELTVDNTLYYMAAPEDDGTGFSIVELSKDRY